MRQRYLIYVFVLLLLVVTIFLGTSAYANNEFKNHDKPEVSNIKVSEFRGLSWCAVYVAQAKGFFSDEGLNVEFVKYADGPIAFQGMHRNDSQFCLLSQEPVLKAQIEGLRSKIIYAVLDTRIYGLVTTKEINDITELKGKTIFAGMPGSAPYSFVSSVLKEAGIDPEKDVTFVNMDYGASIAALTHGQIQALFIDVSNYSEVSKLDVNFIVDTSKPEDSLKYQGASKFPAQIIVATEEFVTQNPNTVQAFINAYHRATLWMHDNTPTEIATVLSPFFEGVSFDDLTDKVSVLLPVLTHTGYIGKSDEENVQKYSIEFGVINKMIPYEEIIDMRFVQNIQK